MDPPQSPIPPPPVLYRQNAMYPRNENANDFEWPPLDGPDLIPQNPVVLGEPAAAAAAAPEIPYFDDDNNDDAGDGAGYGYGYGYDDVDDDDDDDDDDDNVAEAVPAAAAVAAAPEYIPHLVRADAEVDDYLGPEEEEVKEQQGGSVELLSILSLMTVKELMQIAREYRVSGRSGLRKNALINLLMNYF